MILFTILFIALLGVVAFILVAAGMLGSAVAIVFGDVIVCAVLIVWIMKNLIGKKK